MYSRISATIFCFFIMMGSAFLMGDIILQHLQNPRVRALLDMIAYAEGTLHEEGYNVIFGNDRFYSYDDHPRRIICAQSRGEWLCSSAAGRYQLGPATWDHYIQNRKITRSSGDTRFSPLNQDRVAVHIIKDKGALDFLLQEPPQLNKIFEKLNKSWASLPGAPYGQPIRSEAELRKVFNKQLAKYTERERRINGNV